MNIEITEIGVPHHWVVHMDDFEVNFNSQEQADAFVSQLKARIAAPHAWPGAAGRLMRAAAPASGQVPAGLK
jgi:hypothetical protein